MTNHYSFLHRFRRALFAGIATLFPIIITIYIFVSLFKYADNILGKYINKYLVNEFGYRIPGLGILLGLAAILFVGILANAFVGKRLIPFLEKHLLQIPFIKHVYSPAKQLSMFLFKEKREGEGFKRVVLVEYPSQGMFALGFMTNEGISEVDTAVGEKVYAVLVSNSPSPLTGPLMFFPRSKIRALDVKMEDALKLIISGGLAGPSSKTQPVKE